MAYRMTEQQLLQALYEGTLVYNTLTPEQLEAELVERRPAFYEELYDTGPE